MSRTNGGADGVEVLPHEQLLRALGEGLSQLAVAYREKNHAKVVEVAVDMKLGLGILTADALKHLREQAEQARTTCEQSHGKALAAELVPQVQAVTS